MRKTLHDFVIGFDSDAKTTRDALTDFAEKVTRFAKLTNREPKLGDFIPCGEDGNILGKPDIHSLDHSTAVAMHNEYQAALDRVIFKGDWELIESETHIELLCKNTGFWVRQSRITQDWYCKKGIINRIEDLPREIEFKEGVI